MTLFDRCIEVVLKSEGGWQNDPRDIGNRTRDGVLRGTNYGIAARFFYDICKERFSFTGETMRELTLDQAREIYYDYFWKPMNLGGINDKLLILHVFDHGINAGRKTSVRMLQRLVEADPDGICGSRTTTKVNTIVLPQKVIEGYGLLRTLCDYFIYERKRYYTDLTMRRPVTKVYLKGWYNRIERTHF